MSGAEAQPPSRQRGPAGAVGPGPSGLGRALRRSYIAAKRGARAAVDAANLVQAKAGRWGVECAICGGRFREFLPHGPKRRPNARCPRCHSLERHRLLQLYLERRPGFFRDSLRVLHFAPERHFRGFGDRPNLEVVTADVAQPSVDVNLDITRLPLAGDTFDVVLCCHVLEHIQEDRAAMREILRVLKPGGWAVLMVPHHPRLSETFEDPAVTDPAERRRLFGQYDHVRLYGRDFGDRLRSVGFDVTEDPLSREVDAFRYGLRDEPLHVCVKPAADSTRPRAAS